MSNNNTNQSLSDVVEAMDNVAKVAALRGITHSTMAKCIGAIRQHVRDQARSERDEELELGLDQRNTFDENERAEYESKRAMGFEEQYIPIKRASELHAAYDWASTELQTIVTSKWDAPLTVEQMLEFMTKSAPKLDKQLAQALADAAKTDIKTIERMHELQSQREREQLIEATPEILLTFKGFGENGRVDSIDKLPKVDQHQLGIKVVESLNKTRDQVLSRVLRTRRITELGSVPLIEDAITKTTEWVTWFESHYEDEISEAIDAGRNLRTLEDVTL